MAVTISLDTANRIRVIVLRHMSQMQALEILTDLSTVSGNKSYRETIQLLLRILRV